MLIYTIPIIIVILANTSYHIFSKSISPTANPLISLIATYITAIAITLLLLPIFPLQKRLSDSFKELNWASFALALSIIGLEVGFLLAYRTGWEINKAFSLTTAVVATLLIPTGILLFKEHISLTQLLGIILAIFSVILINSKK